jgi:hypothetical protein
VGSEFAQVVGQCTVGHRRDRRQIVCNVRVVEVAGTLTTFAVDLPWGRQIGRMIIETVRRPEKDEFSGPMLKRHFGQRFPGAVDVKRIDGQNKRGVYRGAGTALMLVAAEHAASLGYGLIVVSAVGTSWGFYRRMHLTTGSPEGDVQADRVIRRAEPGVDFGSNTFVLDAMEWPVYCEAMAQAPILFATRRLGLKPEACSLAVKDADPTPELLSRTVWDMAMQGDGFVSDLKRVLNKYSEKAQQVCNDTHGPFRHSPLRGIVHRLPAEKVSYSETARCLIEHGADPSSCFYGLGTSENGFFHRSEYISSVTDLAAAVDFVEGGVADICVEWTEKRSQSRRQARLERKG